MTKHLVITFITIVFLLHPKLAEKSINMFKCIQIDSQTSVTIMDTDIKWYSLTHIKWWLLITLPILVIWVIALPIICLVFLTKNIKDSQENKVKEYLLILYQGLKPEVFYWEFVSMLRKLIILFSTLFDINTSFVFISVAALLSSGILQAILKPYKNTDHNEIEFIAISASVVTLITGLIYSQTDSNKNLNIIALFTMMLINILFLLEWSYLLLKIYKGNYKFVNSVSSPSFPNFIDIKLILNSDIQNTCKGFKEKDECKCKWRKQRRAKQRNNYCEKLV